MNSEQTPRKQAGKDLHFRWNLTVNKGSVSLADCDLTIEVQDPSSRKSIVEHVISEDGKAVEFDFLGTVYKTIGDYTFICWRNYNRVGQTLVDRVKAVHLVRHTYEERDHDMSDLSYDSVDIEGGNLEIGIKGDKGDTGVGVKRVVQTYTSNVDAGANTITVYLSDGQLFDFIVRNGRRGEPGVPGKALTFADLTTAEKENLAQIAFLKYQDILNEKVDKVHGKGLSTNDFTNEDKIKLINLHNYDETGLLARITNEILRAQNAENAIRDSIAILNGVVTQKGSIKYEVATQIADLIDGAPAAFDTFKEIADYIANHSSDVVEIDRRIAGLENEVNNNLQQRLLSGVNIKTINGESILGRGDINVAVENDGEGNEEILSKIGDLSNLTTEQKDSLVDAINEVDAKVNNPSGPGLPDDLPVVLIGEEGTGEAEPMDFEVLITAAQALTAAQKAQVKQNLGIAETGGGASVGGGFFDLGSFGSNEDIIAAAVNYLVGGGEGETFKGYNEDGIVQYVFISSYNRLNHNAMGYHIDGEDNSLAWFEYRNGQLIENSMIFRDQVQDNLDSVSIADPLSANQGRVLGAKVTELERNMETKYTKPADGIPKSDLSSEVQGMLGKGGYEPPVGGIPKSDLASGVQASLNKADSALQQQDISGKQDIIPDLQQIREGANGVAAAQSAAQAAQTSAAEAQLSAAGAESKYNDILQAMQNLPDGAAVSAQVALNSAHISEVEQQAVLSFESASKDSDLDIADGNPKKEISNILARFANGHFCTKHFNSKDVVEWLDAILNNIGFFKIEEFDETKNYLAGKHIRYGKGAYEFIKDHNAGPWSNDDVKPIGLGQSGGGDIVINNAHGMDFAIADSSRNVLMKMLDGHIMTKNFDSRNVVTKPYIDSTLRRKEVIFEARDFTAGLPSIFTANSDWVVSGGKASCSSNSILWTKKKISLNERETIAEFSLDSTGSRFALVWKSDSADGLGACGSYFSVTPESVNIHSSSSSGSLTDVIATTPVNLTVGRRYQAVATKYLHTNIFTLYDGVTGEKLAEVSTHQTSTAGTGEFNGGRQISVCGVKNESGTVSVYYLGARTLIAEPLMVIYGDSITEGDRVYENETYCYLLKECFGHNRIAISGYSGSKISGVIQRISDEIPQMAHKPKYIMVTIGTNGGNTSSLFTQLKNLIESYGCIPIINVPPMCNSMSTAIDNVRNIVLSLGCLTARFDIATATNNDPTASMNSLLFNSDNIHPNKNGHLAMFNRLRIDLKELF